MKPHVRKGQIVAVTFADHCEDGMEPLFFTVYGEVAEVNRKFLSIDSWAYADQRTAHDLNEKRFVIVRSAIKGMVRLVPANGDSPCKQPESVTSSIQAEATPSVSGTFPTSTG